jgi:hypothetical protein
MTVALILLPFIVIILASPNGRRHAAEDIKNLSDSFNSR